MQLEHLIRHDDVGSAEEVAIEAKVCINEDFTKLDNVLVVMSRRLEIFVHGFEQLLRERPHLDAGHLHPEMVMKGNNN